MFAAAAKVLATPAVRRVCREMSIDLSLEPVPGTGPGGRVLKGDVLAYAAKEAATGCGENAESTAVGAAGAAAEGGTGQRPQQAGRHDLAALSLLAKAPVMVLHDDADRLGFLSEPASESFPGPVSRPAEAAGVQVVEEEERWTPPAKEPRRPPGVRGRKEAVSVPIKGDVWDAQSVYYCRKQG